ncbi:hypothetical protein D3C74_75560 [compost metagenome]
MRSSKVWQTLYINSSSSIFVQWGLLSKFILGERGGIICISSDEIIDKMKQIVDNNIELIIR